MNVVVGTVTADLARATLAIGEERHSRQRGDQLVLLVDGVERRFAVATPVMLDNRTLADRWSDLASDPLAQLFLDIAPGDHVKCELTGWRLEPGTPITISELDGQVRVIAVGSDEQTRARVARAMAASQPPTPVAKVHPPIEPPPRVPWRKSVAGLVAFGIIGVSVAVLVATFSIAAAQSVLVPSVVLIAMGVTLGLTRPCFEVVDTQTAPERFRASWSRGSLVAGIATAAISVDLCTLLPFVSLYRPVMPIRLGLLAIVMVIAIVIALRSQRPQRRVARLLRGAGVMRGTLVASEPPLAYSVRYDCIARTGPTGEAKEFWYDGFRTFSLAKPFSLEVGGRRMEVDGQRILWAAPLSYVPLADKQNSVTVAKTNAQIDPGASVLVLGKPIDVNGVPTFQAKGAESFVLFGARGDARAVLRGLLVQWYVRVAFLVAIALGSVVYAGYLGWPPSAPEPAVPAERP